MDGNRFDNLSRTLAGRLTRRSATKGIAAGLLGAFGLWKVTDAANGQCGNVICKNNPGICKPGCVCCVYANGNSRCMAPERCSGTVTPPPSCGLSGDSCIDGGDCCSGLCISNAFCL